MPDSELIAQHPITAHRQDQSQTPHMKTSIERGTCINLLEADERARQTQQKKKEGQAGGRANKGTWMLKVRVGEGRRSEKGGNCKSVYIHHHQHSA